MPSRFLYWREGGEARGSVWQYCFSCKLIRPNRLPQKTNYWQPPVPPPVTTTTPLPLPNLAEFFRLPVPRCLKGGNDSLSTSLRIVKLDQHGRFVHSAESQTALAGYVAGMQQRA